MTHRGLLCLLAALWFVLSTIDPVQAQENAFVQSPPTQTAQGLAGQYECDGEINIGGTVLGSPGKREIARQARMKRES